MRGPSWEGEVVVDGTLMCGALLACCWNLSDQPEDLGRMILLAPMAFASIPAGRRLGCMALSSFSIV